MSYSGKVEIVLHGRVVSTNYIDHGGIKRTQIEFAPLAHWKDGSDGGAVPFDMSVMFKEAGQSGNGSGPDDVINEIVFLMEWDHSAFKAKPTFKDHSATSEDLHQHYDQE